SHLTEPAAAAATARLPEPDGRPPQMLPALPIRVAGGTAATAGYTAADAPDSGPTAGSSPLSTSGSRSMSPARNPDQPGKDPASAVSFSWGEYSILRAVGPVDRGEHFLMKGLALCIGWKHTRNFLDLRHESISITTTELISTRGRQAGSESGRGK